MSTAARKARKRVGERLARVEKAGTPVEERAVRMVWKKGPMGALGWIPSNRERAAVKRRLDAAKGGAVA